MTSLSPRIPLAAGLVAALLALGSLAWVGTAPAAPEPATEAYGTRHHVHVTDGEGVQEVHRWTAVIDPAADGTRLDARLNVHVIRLSEQGSGPTHHTRVLLDGEVVHQQEDRLSMAPADTDWLVPTPGTLDGTKLDQGPHELVVEVTVQRPTGAPGELVSVLGPLETELTPPPPSTLDRDLAGLTPGLVVVAGLTSIGAYTTTSSGLRSARRWHEARAEGST